MGDTGSTRVMQGVGEQYGVLWGYVGCTVAMRGGSSAMWGALQQWWVYQGDAGCSVVTWGA